MLPFLILGWRILWTQRDPVFSGDAALLELAVRSAAHGERTLGPYSRFGFFHPGPAMFYILSPFEFITRDAVWAMPLGVEVLNAVIAAGIVLVVQRSVTTAWHRKAIDGNADFDPGQEYRAQQAGLVAGAAAAAVILGYALAIDIGLLQIFWNPLQIMLPMVLLLISVVFIDGWGWPAAMTLAAATFASQTDLSTVPVSAAVTVCGLIWLGKGLLAQQRRRRLTSPDLSAEPPSLSGRTHSFQLGPALLATLALLVWVPPLVQQITSRSGNVTALVRFFRTSSGPNSGWGLAIATVGRELAVFPYRIVRLGTITRSTVHGRRGEWEFLLFVMLAGTLIFMGRRVHSRVVIRLGVVSVVGAIVSVYSVESIQGPVYWYLTAWMSSVSAGLLLGWVLFLIEMVPRIGRPFVGIAALVVAIIASAIGAGTSVNDNRAFPNEPFYRADVLAAWNVLRPTVQRDRGQTLLLGGDSPLEPTIAGVALKLAHFGINVTVPNTLVPPFGPEEAGSPKTRFRVLITEGAPPLGYQILGKVPSKLLGVATVTISEAVPATSSSLQT